MGYHDVRANKAFREGRSPGEFQRAARRYFNSTWLFVIAAGGVWYLADVRWALVPLSIAAFAAAQSISSTVIAERLVRLKERARAMPSQPQSESTPK